MNVVITLARRNLRLYFRDRAGVFFSLMSALVLVGLYALFLGGLQAENLQQFIPHASPADVRWFVNTWVFAGITMITTLTAALGAMAVFVDDRATGRFLDFISSPIRRWQIVLGYLIAGFVVSLVMALVTVVIGEFYVMSQGDTMMAPIRLLQLLGFVALSAAAFSALTAFAITFFTSNAGFAGLSTVVGTLIGFFAGAYIPPGTLPQGVVNVMNSLPFAQAAMLIRLPYTAGAVQAVTGGHPAAIHGLQTFYGITAYVGTNEITAGIAMAALMGMVVVFATLGTWRLSRSIA